MISGSREKSKLISLGELFLEFFRLESAERGENMRNGRFFEIKLIKRSKNRNHRALTCWRNPSIYNYAESAIGKLESSPLAYFFKESSLMICKFSHSPVPFDLPSHSINVFFFSFPRRVDIFRKCGEIRHS